MAKALVNTILGTASSIKGVKGQQTLVSVAGSLHISGDVMADIRAESDIVISAEARIEGNVEAENVIVGGIVLGSIKAREGVTLLSTAVVLGDIETIAVRLDEGAVLSGNVRKVQLAGVKTGGEKV